MIRPVRASFECRNVATAWVYTALVSGVLIGMSEGLQPGAASIPSGDRSRKK